jgi:hypothetical protein
MKSNNVIKAVISIAVLFVLLLSSAQALQQSTVIKTDTTMENSGWYWKPSYPNYAPAELPDFDQKQDQWKKISAGPNGVIDSTVAGDDVMNVDEHCIAPGPDCYLNSTAAGDDVVEWAFCGPVSVADCLWWFDSKYADPAGTPGDGQDQFALVQDYGAGDDHAKANAPLLIEKLARAMKTTDKGTTYTSDMQVAVGDWFNTTGLSDKFTEQTIDRPTFSYVETQIEQSQNVILLLGSYDFINGVKFVDQSQTNGPLPELCKVVPWTDFQEFIPTVTRLDSIQILLQSLTGTCDVKINVYDAPSPAVPIGSVVMNPGVLASPTWVQFNFDTPIILTPGAMYYFDVTQLLSGYYYEWFYDVGNPYPPGQGWMRGQPVDPYGNPFDWAFQTEYYNPPPHSERREGHFVTCAGVNSEGSMIAFSDPTLDVANPSPDDHNDAQYVSHDVYNVTIGSPQPDINCQWWLTDYPTGYNYTVVEQAVVICPVPDTTPPTVAITRPTNALYFLNKEIVPISVPIIIGLIDVNATASDDDSGMDRVEFYIDNQFQADDNSAPYTWTWTKRGFFYYTLKVVAYDKAGNNDFQELKVWKFF